MGRVVLISGGSRGLGLALAHEFASQGAQIALSARSERELTTAAREIQNTHGADVMVFPCDVADPCQIVGLIDNVEETFGPIQVLVKLCRHDHRRLEARKCRGSPLAKATSTIQTRKTSSICRRW